MQSKGLLGEYSNGIKLEHEVWKAIEHDIALISPGSHPKAVESKKIDFLVQPKQEREVKYDSKGKPRNQTRHWIEVMNTGTEDAEEVTFASVGQPTSMHLGNSEEPTVVHHGQTRRVDTFYTYGGGESVLRITWKGEAGEESKDYHVD